MESGALWIFPDEGDDDDGGDDQGGDAGAHGQNCGGRCCAVALPFTLPR